MGASMTQSVQSHKPAGKEERRPGFESQLPHPLAHVPEQDPSTSRTSVFASTKWGQKQLLFGPR